MHVCVNVNGSIMEGFNTTNNIADRIALHVKQKITK